MGKAAKRTQRTAPRTTAEWVSLGVALILLTGVVGLVVGLWISPSNEPPRFRVDRGPFRNENGQYYLPVIVSNDGDSTGAEVTVQGVLMIGEREEIAETTFDFIPGRARVEGVLVFSNNPDSAAVRVASYQRP